MDCNLCGLSLFTWNSLDGDFLTKGTFPFKRTFPYEGTFPCEGTSL